MQTLINTLMNTIFVSIPEELFLVSIALILCKRADLLKLTKSNIIKGLLVILPIAIISNLLAALKVNQIVKSLSSLVIMITCFSLAYRKELTTTDNKVKNAIKIIIQSIIISAASFTIVILSEYVYMSVVLGRISASINEITKKWDIAFLYSAPSRIIEYTLLLIAIKRKAIKDDFLKIIISDKKYIVSTIVALGAGLLVMYTISQAVILNKAFYLLPLRTQLANMLAVILMPVLYLYSVYFVANGAIANMRRQKEVEQIQANRKLKYMLNSIRQCTNNGTSDTINYIMKDIEKELD